MTEETKAPEQHPAEVRREKQIADLIAKGWKDAQGVVRKAKNRKHAEFLIKTESV